ncbi:hypothetical protein [Epilithonimonas sp.]|uniref:hypothetical protein n=1 Tax=Epilithonimonas sp. TaxID=2894511 RepID=UPI002FDCAC59
MKNILIIFTLLSLNFSAQNTTIFNFKYVYYFYENTNKKYLKKIKTGKNANIKYNFYSKDYEIVWYDKNNKLVNKNFINNGKFNGWHCVKDTIDNKSYLVMSNDVDFGFLFNAKELENDKSFSILLSNEDIK